MTVVRKNLQDAMATMGELRGVENILEHSVQILEQLSVLYLPGYGLTDTDRYFFILSTCLSVASLVRGQLTVFATREGSHLGMTATFLMLFYLAIAALSRGYLMFSGLLMALKETFDCSLNGCPATDYISLVPLVTTLLVLSIHTGLSFAVQTRFFEARKNRFIGALLSLLAPPLDMDWDRMFREKKCDGSVGKCWERSKVVVILYNLLTFGGNLAMGIALLICGHLENDFDLAQVAVLLVPTIISPFLLLGLAYIYYVKFHLWSCILKSELSS